MKQVDSLIKTFLQTQKENLFEEVNPTIIQLDLENVQYAMEVLELFKVDFKWTSKQSVATAMLNKTLEQVLRDRSIDFESSIKLPPRLTNEKGNIKALYLYQTFLEKDPITMTWSNMSSKVYFKSSLEIDK